MESLRLMRLEAIRHAYLRRVVGTALGAIGLDSATSLAKWLARGVFELKTPGSDIARARIRDAIAARPERFIAESGSVDAETIDRTIAAMYGHIARFWTETLFAPRLLRDSSWRRFVEMENEAGLRTLADSGRGCLLATAYHGNIAVAATVLGRIFRPVHVVVDVLTQPRLKAWQRDLLHQKWIRPIERSEAASIVPDVLANGGAVLLIAEHERPRGRAVRAPFLGHTLNCYPTIGRLARWLDVPVGVVTCRREPETFRFTLALHEVIGHDTTERDDTEHDGIEHDDIKHDADGPTAEDRVVCRVMGALENAILDCPAQYLWSTPVVADRSRHHASAEHHETELKTATVTATEAETEVLAAATGTGIEWASSRRTHQTSSASRRPSSAGTKREDPAVPTEPAPTV